MLLAASYPEVFPDCLCFTTGDVKQALLGYLIFRATIGMLVSVVKGGPFVLRGEECDCDVSINLEALVVGRIGGGRIDDRGSPSRRLLRRGMAHGLLGIQPVLQFMLLMLHAVL